MSPGGTLQYLFPKTIIKPSSIHIAMKTCAITLHVSVLAMFFEAAVGNYKYLCSNKQNANTELGVCHQKWNGDPVVSFAMINRKEFKF